MKIFACSITVPHNCDYVEKTEYKVPDISDFRHENKTDVSQ